MMICDKTEGGKPKYYVTACSNGKIQKAILVNIDEFNPDHKPKSPQKPQTTPKKPSPNGVVFSGTSSKAPKQDNEQKITHAYFVDLKGNPVKRIKVGDSVRIRIKTVNMIGENLQFIVKEYDLLSENDKIAWNNSMKIIADAVDTPVITITRERYDRGIDNKILYDYDKVEQQYFIEIIPLGSNAKSKSFGLDDEAKRMKVENGKSPAKVEKTDVKKPPATCICKEQYKDLIWGGKVNCEFRKKVVEICEELWKGRGLEMANGLMAVINVETRGSFKAQQVEGWRSVKDPTKMTIKDFWKNGERKSSSAVGLIQFTQEALQKNMNEYVSNSKLTIEQKFDELNKLKLSYAQMGEIDQLNKVKKYFSNISGIKTPEDIYLAVFAPKGVGRKDDYPLYSGNSKEYKANSSVDTKSTGIHKNDGVTQRSEILERFHDSKEKGADNKTSDFTCGVVSKKDDKSTAKDIVTYHIYSDGKIEKHIPKVIKEEYKQKYKYVYHDDQNAVHEICIADWHSTSKKLKSKSKLYSKPTHAKVISDKNVSDAQTTRRVIYDNGDIAEYGSNDGDTFWRLYSATSEKIELVKMPESVKYAKYAFSRTQRRYTGPNYFAGFLGALAKSGMSVVTTGSCFIEGSCFPSQLHVNGESVDTLYFWDLKKDQKFVDAMRYFHYGEVKVGQFEGKNGPYFSSLKNVSDGGKLHNSHFHSGEFDESKIIIK